MHIKKDTQKSGATVPLSLNEFSTFFRGPVLNGIAGALDKKRDQTQGMEIFIMKMHTYCM